MSDTLTQLDPEISFDQRPGRMALIGQQKPQAVIDQIVRVTEAWNEYNATVDEYLTWPGERTQLRMSAALKAAQAQARLLDEMQQGAQQPETDRADAGLVYPGVLM